MAPDQLSQYVPVLLLLLVAVGFAGGVLLLSVLLGFRGHRNRNKDIPYECGMLPIGEGSTRMSVKFYLVAMLFILFDIEAAFLIPWAVTFKGFAADKAFVLGEMAVFLGILVAGYLYLWWRGALDWE
jgi:NADH-quinone oxidoreductase subunit A